MTPPVKRRKRLGTPRQRASCFFSFVIDVFSRKGRGLAVRQPHAHDARARCAGDGALHPHTHILRDRTC
jgi:transposase InsO family protein